MKKSKGQVIIEFALILPLFLFLVLGIFYSGMLFHDYSTLSNVARSAAREAAIAGSNEGVAGNYFDDNGKLKAALITNLYAPQGTTPLNVVVSNNDVTATITMELHTNLPFIDAIVPQEFEIKYHMRVDSSG